MPRSRWSRSSPPIISGAGACCAISPLGATSAVTSGTAGSTSFPRSCCSPRCCWLSSSLSSEFFATAPRGLEALLLQELQSLGAQNAAQVPGGVAFGGGWEVCYRANLWSRIASRVLWKVHAFAYANESDVYEKAKAVDWPRFFSVGRTLRVNVTAQKSPLKSLEFATLRIKDAVCDRFRDAAGRRPDVDRTAPDVRVHALDRKSTRLNSSHS